MSPMLTKIAHRLRSRFLPPPLLGSRAAYALWAPHYPPIAHNRFMEIEQAALLKWLPADLSGQAVLDLACGTGRWGRIAAERGGVVYSLDSSPAMLRQGRPPHATEGLMSQLPYGGSRFALILCGLAVGHIVTPHLWATLAESSRVLEPGGRLLLSDVHPAQAWAGARRNFQAGGRAYAVEHYIHSYADYHAASAQVGLQITGVQELGPGGENPHLSGGRGPVLLALCLQKLSKNP